MKHQIKLILQRQNKKPEIVLYYLFLALFLFFLPFNHTLVIRIGFPLKISEIAIIGLVSLSVVLYFRNRNFIYRNCIQFPSKYLYVLAAFFLLYFFSTVFNFFYAYPYTLDYYEKRFSIPIDSMLKCGYLLMSYSCFFLSYLAFKLNKTLFLKIYIAGAVAASIYAWYLFSFSLLNLHYSTLPGGVEHPQAALFKFGHFIRAGSFKEGNLMGMFLVVSGIISIYAKKYKLSGFLFLTLITTASSAAFFTTVLFFGGYFFHLFYHRRQYKKILFFSLTSLFIFASLCISPDFRYMMAKFGLFPSKANADATFSKGERLNLASVALNIGVDNFIVGVGPNNFAWHYTHYNKQEVYNHRETRMAANNVYLEIFSETGLISLMIFLLFLFFLLKKSFKHENKLLFGGLITILTYFFAYPTFTTLFIWVYFALILAHNENNTNNN